MTERDKISRAEDIAMKLTDNNLWKSHGRPINIEILERELKLKITDYGQDAKLRQIIRSYYTLAADYIKKNETGIFIHLRNISDSMETVEQKLTNVITGGGSFEGMEIYNSCYATV